MSKSRYRSLADVVLDFADDLDMTDEVAVLRWALDELVRAYRDGAVSAPMFAKLAADVVKALNSCRDTTARIIFARQNVITPAEFSALMKALGNVVQTYITDPAQRRAVAMKFADLVKGLKTKGAEFDGKALEAGQE
jgi:uncharacterized protein YejL (UPF0352 family)